MSDPMTPNPEPRWKVMNTPVKEEHVVVTDGDRSARIGLFDSWSENCAAADALAAWLNATVDLTQTPPPPAPRRVRWRRTDEIAVLEEFGRFVSHLDHGATCGFCNVARYRLQTLEKGSPMTEATPNTEAVYPEVAWLIERGPNMKHMPIVYWTGDVTIGIHGWITDPNKAIRYPTQEAAAAIVRAENGHGPAGYLFGQAVQHGWLDTRRDA